MVRGVLNGVFGLLRTRSRRLRGRLGLGSNYSLPGEHLTSTHPLKAAVLL